MKNPPSRPRQPASAHISQVGRVNGHTERVYRNNGFDSAKETLAEKFPNDSGQLRMDSHRLGRRINGIRIDMQQNHVMPKCS